jgi:hypothetical protein
MLAKITITLVMGAALLLAQQETGGLTGQVTDQSGAVIANARVTVTNQGTGVAFAATTSADGFYSAPQLAPGFYSVSAESPGLSKAIRKDIEVRVADRLRVDLPMQVGDVTQQVVIQAAAPLLQTEDATAGQVIDEHRINDLPLNGRNWLQLATLAPGTVTYPGAVDGQSPQDVILNIGGNRTNQTDYLIDGADNNMFLNSGTAVAYPPVDSLQEFKVETNDYTVDTGRMGGAVVNTTIKSGTNEFHGSAYDFLRNRDLSARNYFSSPTAPKPEFTRNQYGASLGGPVRKSKLFFFLNYEANRQRQDATTSTTVFTPAQRAGDFSSQLGKQIGVDALGRPVFSGEIFDPTTLMYSAAGTPVRSGFPGNKIPASMINPVSLKLMSLLPEPNTSGSPNYVVNLSAPLNIQTYVGRLDWVHSEKDSVYGHMIYSDVNQVTQPLLGNPLDGGSALPNLETDQRGALAAWTHIFNPSFLNEFSVQFLRDTWKPLTDNPTQNLNSYFGIGFPDPGAPAGGLALLTVSGYTSIGSNASTDVQPIDKYALADSFTVVRGSHTLKFGIRGEQKRYYNQINCTYCRGTMSFSGAYTNQQGFGATGSSVADFLLGIGASAQYRTLASYAMQSNDVEAFVQDRWRVTSKLTVTLGLQYIYDPLPHETSGSESNVLFSLANPGSAQVVVPDNMSAAQFNLMKNVLLPFLPVNRATGLGSDLVRNPHLDFAPRLALAWQFTPSTVLRAGYGVFYGANDVTNASIGGNPPSRITLTPSGNNVTPSLFINQPIVPANPFSSALVNDPSFTVLDPNMRPSFNQMYNINLQHQLGGHWVVEVGYMGNRDSGILINVPINTALPALPNNTSSTQSRRIVSTALGAMTYLTPQGYSNYNALTVNVEKRFSAGFTLLANYTWSRALGVAPAFTEGINTPTIQNPLNLSSFYGPLEFDIKNRFVISSLYELPFGKGKRFLGNASRPLDLLVGGWQLNGIGTLQGGLPITPVLSLSLGKTDINSRPDLVGNTAPSNRGPSNWLNPAAFSIPNSAAVAAGDFYGNEGTGVVRAPGLANLDLSLFKDFTLRERIRLQFRAECFNCTNTPFFGESGSIGVTVGSPSFGKASIAADPRIVQLALKLLF